MLKQDFRLVFLDPPHHFLIFFIFLNFTVLYLTDLEILGFLRKVMGGVQKYQSKLEISLVKYLTSGYTLDWYFDTPLIIFSKLSHNFNFIVLYLPDLKMIGILKKVMRGVQNYQSNTCSSCFP